MEGTTTPAQDLPQEERLMAGLAHISVIIPMAGFIAPVVIWVTQKDKSRFVYFQALQAAVLQILIMAIYIVGMVCYAVGIFGGIAVAGVFNQLGGSRFPAFFILPVAIMGLLLLIDGALVIYGIVGAVMSFLGKNFRYVLIGDAIDRYLARRPAQPSASVETPQ